MKNEHRFTYEEFLKVYFPENDDKVDPEEAFSRRVLIEKIERLKRSLGQ